MGAGAAAGAGVAFATGGGGISGVLAGAGAGFAATGAASAVRGALLRVAIEVRVETEVAFGALGVADAVSVRAVDWWTTGAMVEAEPALPGAASGAGALLCTDGAIDEAAGPLSDELVSDELGALTGGGVTSGASTLWASRGVDDRAMTAAIAVMPGRSGDLAYLMRR